MPLPGGPADKAGNLYEARWTVVCMAGVLRGEYDSIRLEPPGPEGEGVDFYLRRGDTHEYHQVKRQIAGVGHWTLRELNARRVLPAFRNHLTDERAKCVFVSMQDAHVLRELADRARRASRFEEFEREFIKGEWGSRFSELSEYWPGCTRDQVFRLIKRIHVHTIDEDFMRQHAELLLDPLVESNPSLATDVLFAYAFESVHLDLDSAKIEGHLKFRGLNRPAWADPQTLARAVGEANDRYLTSVDGELIRGTLIQRDESVRVLAALQDGAAKRGVILTGGAGAGKSTVLLEVLNDLQRQGVPILAFRVDRLEPTQCPDKAGQQVGLPASPVAALAERAQGRPCVLVLDQLDAVSLMSGRNPSFFDCFDEMVSQALTIPTMRLLIACRRFDFENDHRLRRLGGRDDVFEMVEVGLLSDDTVRQTVQALGIDAAGLSNRQIGLLSLPAHLKLLADVAGEDAASALGFQTANDLYDLYWRRKQAILQDRLGRPVAWAGVIQMLCDYMNGHQVLSVPEASLDAHGLDAQAMISEGVLVQDGKRIAFFHEGFFDYAFARSFTVREIGLVDLLCSDEQHLFRRAQVRQILLYERENDLQRYLMNLEAILKAHDIRFHIKHLVLALLSETADPTEKEWRILEALLEDADYPCRHEIWVAIRTIPWFRLLDSLNVVAGWLEQGDGETVNRAVELLRFVQRHASDRVAELMEPYVGASEEWRKRHRFVVQWADLSASRRMFDLFLKLISNGDIDSKGNGRSQENDCLGMLYQLSESRAAWACEAIAAFIARCLEQAIDHGLTSPFSDEGGLSHSQVADHVLIGAAQRAPESFVEHVIPLMLRVIELNSVREGELPVEDTVWRCRFRDGGHSVEHHLLHAAEEALRTLARKTPSDFRRVAEPLRNSEYETVQFLLMRAYSANGEGFADEAIDCLCESASRLSCGYANGGFSHRVSRELIEAATPFCSDDRLATLEAMLLEYHTEWERTANGCRERGLTQFELLVAINKARRSTLVKARIGEWQRKFRTDAPPERQLGGVMRVGSPLPASAAENMTDDNWLGAIACYPSDRARVWRDGKPMGGPQELSETLEAQVKKEPARFAHLVHRFPDGANALYFSAVLEGLCCGEADAEALWAVCRRCHRLPQRPTGSAFCHLVGKLAELSWPHDLLDAVAWYATEDPCPDREQWRTEASSGKYYYGGDIYTAGINCVRGDAAGAVRSLLEADAKRIKQLLPTLQRMVQDPSIAVRSCVVTALFPLLNHDRDLAMRLFLDLCDTEDVLLATHYMEVFMLDAIRTHCEQLQPIVDRMLCSPDSEVAQAGARCVSKAFLDALGAPGLAEKCLEGATPLRKGAAQVFAANVGDARFRVVCQDPLVQLFEDSSEEVRALAAQCFQHLEGDALGELTELVEGFLSSAAFEADHQPLILALHGTTARLPNMTIIACERFIEIAGSAAGDMLDRVGLDAHLISELIVRAYHQADDEAVKTRCLDRIDDLLRLGARGLPEVLREVDR